MIEIIVSYPCGENTELRVTKITRGYSVTYWDLDVNEALPTIKIFQDESSAIKYAEDTARQCLANL